MWWGKRGGTPQFLVIIMLIAEYTDLKTYYSIKRYLKLAAGFMLHISINLSIYLQEY